MKYLFSFILVSILHVCSLAELNAQARLDYTDSVKINGIYQFISVQGTTGAPLILFLHGGPGSSRMKQAGTFTNLLQKKFTVVQWDQRETGRTQQMNASTQPLSLSLMEQDTHDLIDSLLNRFHKSKLYLAGESWGTVLGFNIADKYPSLLNAYLAFSPVIDQITSEQLGLSMLKKATADNATAQKELAGVKIPFENGDQIYYLRKWMFYHDGSPLPDKDTSLIKDYVRTWSVTWLDTWRQAMQRNLFKTLPAVNCPVYFFVGGKDYQTNFSLSKAYYDKLTAPKKEFFLFENAGHSLLTTEADAVQHIIMEKIL